MTPPDFISKTEDIFVEMFEVFNDTFNHFSVLALKEKTESDFYRPS